MLRLCVFIAAAIAALGADDPWAKVRALKSGAEIRVYKRDAKQPVVAKMDELTEENLVVVLKNEQVAIARDRIDRIEARQPATSSRVTKETKTTQEPPAQPGDRPHTSYSSGISIGDKPGFETIYRRRAAPPPK